MKPPKRPKPPRAVRAWAEELGRACWRECRASAKTRKVTVTLQFERGNPAPYAHRIAESAVDALNSVPDATPSAEAEVRRFKTLLRKASRELKTSPFPEDRRLADEIDAALRRRG